MKNSIQLIVYDFDGTLVDTKIDIAISVNCVLEELCLPNLPHETIFNFVGRGVHNLMTQSLKETGFTNTPLAIELFMKYYEKHLMDNTDFFSNCRDIINTFSHKKQAILSNKPSKFIKIILENLNCLDPFCKILGGDSFESKKPDPQGLIYLMNNFKLSSENLIMVGDSLVDIETAQRAGVPVCAVTYGHASREALKTANPNWIIDDLLELKKLLS